MSRDPKDRLDMIREVVRWTHQCVASIEEAQGFQLGPESPAALDDARVTPVSYRWGPKPFRFVQEVAGSYTWACQDHMKALERILHEPVPAFADVTVARGVVETAARAWWLHDPTVSPLDRLARGWTEVLAARRERDRSPEPTQDERTEDDPSLEERARQGAEDDGLDVSRRQPTTDLVSWMDPRIGEAAWRWMSGIAHGMPAHVLTRTEAVADVRSPTGRLRREKPRSIEDEAFRVLAPALEAHAAAYERRIAYHGWDDTEWRRQRQDILAAFVYL